MSNGEPVELDEIINRHKQNISKYARLYNIQLKNDLDKSSSTEKLKSFLASKANQSPEISQSFQSTQPLPDLSKSIKETEKEKPKPVPTELKLEDDLSELNIINESFRKRFQEISSSFNKYKDSIGDTTSMSSLGYSSLTPKISTTSNISRILKKHNHPNLIFDGKKQKKISLDDDDVMMGSINGTPLTERIPEPILTKSPFIKQIDAPEKLSIICDDLPKFSVSKELSSKVVKVNVENKNDESLETNSLGSSIFKIDTNINIDTLINNWTKKDSNDNNKTEEKPPIEIAPEIDKLSNSDLFSSIKLNELKKKYLSNTTSNNNNNNNNETTNDEVLLGESLEFSSLKQKYSQQSNNPKTFKESANLGSVLEFDQDETDKSLDALLFQVKSRLGASKTEERGKNKKKEIKLHPNRSSLSSGLRKSGQSKIPPRIARSMELNITEKQKRSNLQRSSLENTLEILKQQKSIRTTKSPIVSTENLVVDKFVKGDLSPRVALESPKKISQEQTKSPQKTQHFKLQNSTSKKQTEEKEVKKPIKKLVFKIKKSMGANDEEKKKTPSKAQEALQQLKKQFIQQSEEADSKFNLEPLIQEEKNKFEEKENKEKEDVQMEKEENEENIVNILNSLFGETTICIFGRKANSKISEFVTPNFEEQIEIEKKIKTPQKSPPKINPESAKSSKSVKSYDKFAESETEDEQEFRDNIQLDYEKLKDTLNTIKEMGIGGNDSTRSPDLKSTLKKHMPKNEEGEKKNSDIRRSPIRPYNSKKKEDEKKNSSKLIAKKTEKKTSPKKEKDIFSYLAERGINEIEFDNSELYQYLSLLTFSDFDHDEVIYNLKTHILKLINSLMNLKKNQ